MRYDIYKNGKYVNGIVASEDFILEYCRKNGYTYREIQREDPPAFIVENNPKLSDQKITAVSDRMDFLEDCIAEMAMQVYSE